MKKVLIVIVNYRSAELTMDCLASLGPELSDVGDMADCRVIVVENDSRDGSTERLARAIETRGWLAWATLLPLNRNAGFAGGNNAAIRPALASAEPPDYVLLLNPDTVVKPGAVRRLVEFLNARPDVGMAGSGLENADGSPQASAFRFHTILSEFETALRLGLASRLLSRWSVLAPMGERPHAVEWACGASLMIRREVFRDVGLLDEDYFLYYEETDFCLRAARAGWPCWLVPQSRVVHLCGQSTGVTDPLRPRKRMPQYWFESRHRYFVRNHGKLYALAADAAWAMGFAFWRLRRRLQRKPDNDPPRLLSDFVSFRLQPG